MFIFLVLNFFYVALWGLNTNFVKSGKAIQILEKNKFFLSKIVENVHLTSLPATHPDPARSSKSEQILIFIMMM